MTTTTSPATPGTANSASAASPAVAPTAPPPMTIAEVLRNPVMKKLWIAQIVSVFGDFLALFAVISVLTFKLNANPRQVTGLQISMLLPIAVFGVIAGVFVDRWNVKRLLVSSDVIRGTLILLLVVATQVWHYYLILALVGVVSSAFGPAQGVAIRTALPLHGLRSANMLMTQVMFGMRIVGPAAAAYLVAGFGASSAYYLDSISFAISASLIASVTMAPIVRQPPPPGSETSTPLGRVWLDMKQGLDFIFHHAGLLFVILAFASGMFVVGCFGPLIAIYVRDSVHASTKVFGLASATMGVGMLVGMNVLHAVAKSVRNTVLVYSGLIGMGAGLVVLTVIPLVWTTLTADFVIGFAVAGILVPAQVMIQQETPPALMGRVGSTMMSLVFSAQISGLLVSGVIGGLIGVRQVFALCAVLLVVLAVAGKLWMEPKSPAAAAKAATPAGLVASEP